MNIKVNGALKIFNEEKIKSSNVVWHDMNVTRRDREELLNQQGKLIWFTGLSGSGKSTVASVLEKKLHDLGKLTYTLDGDNVRHGLNKDLGFSNEDRIENIRRIGEISKLFVDAGIITIATFVSPFNEDRERVRELIDKDFIEVYIDCPLEICEERDPKGLYKKARAGKIKDFTGIDSIYEIPQNPEITVSTHLNSIEECVDKIIGYLAGGRNEA
ncbi:adenylyl-sulfate kinase [Clostridium sp. 'White wine YQ']|uniref:adenylyl-sulfate kinase n=1 Tax=Clostridium sp. 'White wine YQ' TaxID=3027474 RepID=UPI0023651FEB|nr:adenylyl-sulfate kinase [Clostridium sp. 'White wine YQ']MDD7795867.1 adenylyl-sulfate kinase [Clostridium sp. 'White wine YQ']